MARPGGLLPRGRRGPSLSPTRPVDARAGISLLISAESGS